MLIREPYKGFLVRKPKPQAPPTVEDQLAQVVTSRRSEQEDIAKMALLLQKWRCELQRRIQASRAKFHLARWKLINKAMDD